MAYITDLLKGTIEPHPDCISLERYVQESAYVTQYLSRVVKDKALVVYHVLFYLSWFKTGTGNVTVPWAEVGSFIRSEQRNIIGDSKTVKRRLPDLRRYKCISEFKQPGNPNKIFVHLPSDIAGCRELIDQEEREARVESQVKDERDYYNDPGRRLMILDRDGRVCVYCTALVSEKNFELDHLLPQSKGGTNWKYNLATACEVCNRRRSDYSEPVSFLLENYRLKLISQEEFLRQKDYIETLLAKSN